MTRIKTTFELETVTLPLSKILPTRTVSKAVKAGSKYKQMAASFPVVGIIEPLMVWRQTEDMYILLDGHKRLSVLSDAQVATAECIVSTDDEGYTFNRHVNRLAPIQANKMIVRALDAGVPEDRLADALDLAPATIRMSRSMLTDICPEALELLKDKPVAVGAFGLMKYVVAIRQIEIAELMNKLANWSKPYAIALVSSTRPDLLVEHAKVKKLAQPKTEDLARMEAEMHALERDILLVDDSYGRDVVNLTLARAYVKKLLENAKVVKYLAAKHADILSEFQRMHEMTSAEA